MKIKTNNIHHSTINKKATVKEIKTATAEEQRVKRYTQRQNRTVVTKI